MHRASLLGLMASLAMTNVLRADGDIEFFESRVRPLLVERCFKCHGPQSKDRRGGLRLDSRSGVLRGGNTGASIVVGQPDASLLISAVRYDGDLQMPPDRKLSAEEIAILSRWVKIGAPWPNSPVPSADTQDAFPLAQRKRAHWAWQAPQRPQPRTVVDTSWPLVPLDNFILARLEAAGLKPARPAERDVWLRRVSFDLTGLPPTRADLESFLADHSAHPHERVVDRLLNSPHFGEHWARRWMDVVRFAETKGFETDYTMPFVYRYRDYLVRAFNADVPYDTFVREAIAGDLMEHPRRDSVDGSNESIAGPGFFYLFDSHHGPPDIHSFEVRAFDNMIDATSKAFLALTVACARCHDHKFDAITTRDYYSMYGILAESRFHYANTVSPQTLARTRDRLDSLKSRFVERIVPAMLEDLGRIKESIAETQTVVPLTTSMWRRLTDVDTKDVALSPAVRLLTAKPNALATTWESLAQTTRAAPTSTSANLGALTRRSFGEWRPTGMGMGTRPARPGTFIIPPGDDVPRAVFAGGASAGFHSSRMDGALKSPTFQLEDAVSVRVKGRHARVRLFVRNYELVGQGVTTRDLDQQVNSDVWKWIKFDTRLWNGQPAHLEILHNGDEMEVVTRKQHEPTHSEDAFVAFDRAVLGGPSKEAPGKFESTWRVEGEGPKTRAAVATHLLDVIADLLESWRDGTLASAEAELLQAILNAGPLVSVLEANDTLRKDVERMWLIAREPPQPKYVRTLVDGRGRNTPVYLRGNHQTPTPSTVPRHFLDALTNDVGFASPPTRGSGRREWAEALVHRRNPLTARVIVNRIWSHLFGRGIVATVDNFGVMGERPSHPLLLDELATKLQHDGWSLKRAIREIAVSQTYRQSSQATRQQGQTPGEERQATEHQPSRRAAVDPENRLLSHMPVRRLPAESIRDAILQASGRLDSTMYGRSVTLDLTRATPSRSKPTKNGPTDGDGRRSVYLEIRRNYMSEFLRAFDQPTATAPRGQRAVTNVPAQALSLMNDPFVVQQARVWAEQVLRVEDSSLDDRTHAVHRAAFGRPARKRELDRVQTVVREVAAERGLSFEDAGNDVDVWTDLCHLMMNRKEFIFLF